MASGALKGTKGRVVLTSSREVSKVAKGRVVQISSREVSKVAKGKVVLISSREVSKVAPRDHAPDLETYAALIAASQLADETKRQYSSRLGKLVDATMRPVAWTLQNCVESWASLKAQYGPENYITLRTFVNLALSLLNNNAEAAGMGEAAAREAHGCWTKLYAEVSPRALEHYETNEPTEKMLDSHVPWAELERVRDRLVKERPHAIGTLLLAFYTYIPPSRINFASTRIYGWTVGGPEPPVPDSAEKRAEPNFLAIERRRGADPTVMTLTISAFKNRSVRFPRSVRELPAPLVALVESSLAERPRDYLFVSPRTGLPWSDAIAFGNYMRDILRRIFGRPVTANSMRHAFATALDMNIMTPREKDATAAMMMTSSRQLERYRMRMPEDESNNAEGQLVCRLTCGRVPPASGRKAVVARGVS